MPAIIRGTVKFDDARDTLGEYVLRDITGRDAISRILEQHNGKNIDMIISIREHTS